MLVRVRGKLCAIAENLLTVGPGQNEGMRNRPFVLTMIILLTCGYGGGLTVSAAHLTLMFQLFNKGLPDFVSLGLAIALEVVAFLLSLISTSLGSEVGPSAARGSTAALLLVWAGNGYAMWLAAPSQPWYVTIGASCFVPICTLMVGKTLGGLFNLLDRLTQEKAGREAALNRQQHSRPDTTDRPQMPEPQRPERVPIIPSGTDFNLTHTSPVTAPGVGPVTSGPAGDAVVPEPVASIPTAPTLTAEVVVPMMPTEPPLQRPRPISASTDIRGSAPKVEPDRTETELSSGTPHPDPDTRQHLQQRYPKTDEGAVHEFSLVPESPKSAKTKVASSRKEKPNLIGVRALADEPLSDQALADQTEADQVLFIRTLQQAGITWSELDGLARLVKAGWPPATTPRLLTARQAVLVWAYVRAGASKTGLAVELGLSKKNECTVRSAVASVEAVLEAFSRSHVVNPAPAKTPHVHVSGQRTVSAEAAAGGAPDPVEFEHPDVNTVNRAVKP